MNGLVFFILGFYLGIVFMCLFQINQQERLKGEKTKYLFINEGICSETEFELKLAENEFEIIEKLVKENNRLSKFQNMPKISIYKNYKIHNGEFLYLPKDNMMSR